MRLSDCLRIVLRLAFVLLVSLVAQAATGSPGTGPAQWRARLATDANKMHKNVFPGVDLIFHGAKTRINAQMIVHPGADLSAVHLDMAGASERQIGTEVNARLAKENLAMRLLVPQIFQAQNGQKAEVAGNFIEKPDGSLGISAPVYDRNQPLIISFVAIFHPADAQKKAGAEVGAPTIPTAVTITASKTDQVVPDNDNDGKATAGETIKYTVRVKNTGDMDATGVSFAEDLDANTTFTDGTIKTTPLAYKQTLNILEDAVTPVTLTGNDADGGNLTFAIDTAPTKGATGSVTQNPPASASVTYTPNANVNNNTAPSGADNFVFKATDADANVRTATVTINITPVNDAPLFSCGDDQTHNSTDSPAITVNGWATGIAAGPATATDETGQALTFNLRGNTNAAIFSVNPAVNSGNGNLTYTLSGQAGQSTVTFRLKDNGGTTNGGVDSSAACSLVVTVNGAPLAVNDAPAGNSAPGDAFHTAFNTTLNSSTDANTPSVLANDNRGFPEGNLTHFGGGSLGGSVTSNSAGNTVPVGSGSLMVNANGEFVFTPDNNFTGLFTFSYRLTNVADFSDATVTIAVGTRPQAFADAFTATGNIAIAHTGGAVFGNNGSGADLGSQISVTQVQGSGANVGNATNTNTSGLGGVFGRITLAADGSFTYDPPPGYRGADTFTYTVGNGFGNSTPATVTITTTNMVWFIVNGDGGSNRGTFNHPFATIAAFNAINAGAAPNAQQGDYISLRSGSGTYAEVNGINLRDNQVLIGGSIQFNTVFAANTNSIAAYTTFASGATSQPRITASGGNGVDLAGSNTVRGVTVGNTSGFGFNGGAVGSPTINSVKVTGNGGAINISTSGSFGSNVTFDSLSSNNASAQAINLVGVTGTLGVTAGSISAPTGTAVVVNGGTVGMAYPGSITKNNAGGLIDISNKTGGTIDFSQALSNSNASATGIIISNSSGATTTFSGSSKVLNTGANAAVTLSNCGTVSFTNGGLDIDATSGNGFSATSGGTIAVTGAGNTINCGTGRALNVVSTDISAGNLTFESISHNGGTNGIVLSTTGSSGGLTVTGDAGSANNGSGGTIQNTSDAGILLSSTRNVSFDQLNLSSTAGSGVQGTSVTNYTHTNSTFTNVGNAFNESGIAFNDNDNVNTGVGDTGQGIGNNINGTLTVTGNSFTNPFYSGLDVQSNNGTVSNATVSNNTISNPGFSGVNLVGTGTASTVFNLTKATIASNSVTSSGGNGIQVSIGNGNASGPGATAGVPGNATNIISITGNTVSLDGTGTQAITVANVGGNSSSRTQTNFEIKNNPSLTGSLIGSVVLVGNNGYSTMTGVIDNNVIDANHTANGGGGNGIAGGNGVAGAGNAWTPDLTLTVSNNTITDTDGSGILLVGRGTSGMADLRVTGNNVAAPINAGGSARQGIRVEAGNSSSADDAVCLNISGNTSAGSNGAAGIGIRKQGTVATTNDFGLTGLSPSPATGIQAAAFVASNNPTGNGCDAISGDNFVSCSTAP